VGAREVEKLADGVTDLGAVVVGVTEEEAAMLRIKIKHSPSLPTMEEISKVEEARKTIASPTIAEVPQTTKDPFKTSSPMALESFIEAHSMDLLVKFLSNFRTIIMEELLLLMAGFTGQISVTTVNTLLTILQFIILFLNLPVNFLQGIATKMKLPHFRMEDIYFLLCHPTHFRTPDPYQEAPILTH
jgi:hypothetical protein